METNALSEKESLELITRMIQNTRTNMEHGGGKLFLLWGYDGLIISLLVYFLLKQTGNPEVQFLFWLIPLIGYTLMFLFLRKKAKPITTYVDKSIGHIWLTLGVGFMLTPLMLIWVDIPVIFFVSLLMGIGVGISGFMIGIQSIRNLGFLGMLFSCLLLFVKGPEIIPAFCITILTCMILPGYILNRKSAKIKENV
ncbi:MAG: hypothetical protein PHS48_00655 [Bacteroidales bacterium]|nr:hypothetical protein [Bacteroidales bacterium]